MTRAEPHKYRVLKNLHKAIFGVMLLWACISQAQDPYFLETGVIRSFVNPALTGLDGSLSFRVVSKNQFLTANPSLLSAGISAEQSVPCSRIDFGFHYIFDREGDGLLRSNFLGGNFVYTVPFKLGLSDHNLRLGMKAEWISKSIDWSRLYFSDQIDPKYGIFNEQGNPNPGAFVPPEWNRAGQLGLGIGFVHRAVLGGRVKNWTLTWGIAVDNYTSLFEDKYYDSLLKLEKDQNALINKISAHVSAEFPLIPRSREYLGFSPRYLFQSQMHLTSQQLGFEFNYQNAYTFGAYFNVANFQNFRADTKSLVFETTFRVLTTRTAQLNLGLHYMHHIGGLSAVNGQSLQVTVRYTLRKDMCATTPDQRDDCPQISQTDQMLYENIWYRTDVGKKPGL